MGFFLEGYDHCDAGSESYKWSHPDGLLPPSIIGGRQATGVGGGFASAWISTTGGFVYATKTIGASQYWALGFDIMPLTALDQDQTIFRFEGGPSVAGGSNPSTVLQLVMQPNGAIAFYTGGDGTNANPGSLLATTDPGIGALALGQWTYVEMLIQFGLGSIFVNFEDVNVLSRPNLQVSIDTPDRFSRTWQGYVGSHGGFAGYAIDNLYLANGQTDAFGNVRTFLGPSRISCYFPATDIAPPTWTRNAGTSDAGAIGHRGSVGSTSWLDSNAGALDWYTLANNAVPCYGRVYAVAANAAIRQANSGRACSVDLQARAGGGRIVTDLGSGTFNSTDYGIVQGCYEASIADPTRRWNAQDIQQAWWGLANTGANPARCGQYFIEQMVALRNLPYNCGQNSYSW